MEGAKLIAFSIALSGLGVCAWLSPPSYFGFAMRVVTFCALIGLAVDVWPF